MASSSSSSSSSSSFFTKKRGRRQDNVWEYFEQERDKERHSPAKCIFCEKNYSRGDITQMQGHLANHCVNCPTAVIRQFQTLIEESQNKKIKRSTDQTSLESFHDVVQPLSQGRVDRINRALIKLFVCCGISFRIVESPFFVDFVKELNASYDPPSREILSGRLFESELGYVNSKINKELDNSDNLTLGN